MKRALAALLAATMILSVTSCTEPSVPANSEEPTTETETTENTASLLPRGDDPVYLPAESAIFAESDLPEDIRYLDDTRDLKDSYTLSEAWERYAIKLHYSTLIVTPGGEYTFNHTFCCCNYESRRYDREDLIYFHDESGTYDLILEDTKCATLSEFKQAFLTSEPITELEKALKTTKEATIIEEADDYTIGMIPYYSNLSTFNYYYYFAKVIGNRVYVTRRMNEEKKLDESGLEYFKEKSLTVFKDLHEDDGKEPYIYDKVVNISYFGDKHVRSFDSIFTITPTYVAFRSITYDRLYINPSDHLMSLYGSEWEDHGDMLAVKGEVGVDAYVFTVDGVKYLLGTSVEVNSSDELIKKLTEAGLII